MHQSLIIPNLKARGHVRQDIKTMCGGYSGLVVVMLDMMCRAGVAAVIEEMDAIEGHGALDLTSTAGFGFDRNQPALVDFCAATAFTISRNCRRARSWGMA